MLFDRRSILHAGLSPASIGAEFRSDATVFAIEPHNDLRQDRNQSLAQFKLPICATVASKIEVRRCDPATSLFFWRKVVSQRRGRGLISATIPSNAILPFEFLVSSGSSPNYRNT